MGRHRFWQPDFKSQPIAKEELEKIVETTGKAP